MVCEGFDVVGGALMARKDRAAREKEVLYTDHLLIAIKR